MKIVPVTGIPVSTQMNRREFLGVSITAAAVVGILSQKTTAFAENKPQNATLPVKVIKAHRDPIRSLAIGSDGTKLASGSNTGSNTGVFKLWALPEGKLVFTQKVFNDSLRALLFDPTMKFLVSDSNDSKGHGIKLWALPKGLFNKTYFTITLDGPVLDGHKDYVHALAITPNGQILVSGSSNGNIKLWSFPGGALLANLDGNGSWVWDLAITPDGQTLASGSSDSTIKLWDLPKKIPVGTLEGHEGGVRALSITPDGTILISGHFDNTIKLWNIAEEKLVGTLNGHQNHVRSLAITPDGKILASASGENFIKLWALPNGNLESSLTWGKSNIEVLTLTPDGKFLISGGSDGTVILWI